MDSSHTLPTSPTSEGDDLQNENISSVLLQNLGPEDRHYLNLLMDNETSDSSDGEDDSRLSSAWSPMVYSPVLMSRRIRRMRTTNSITLSLEENSYIRPSWGISKELVSVEQRKKRKRPSHSDGTSKLAKAGKRADQNDKSYCYFLLVISVVVFLLTAPTYWYTKKNSEERIHSTRFKLDIRLKLAELYLPKVEPLNSLVTIHFGQGIPNNLKPSECTCKLFTSKVKQYLPNETVENEDTCISCLDWAYRANLRVVLVKPELKQDIMCYDFKWQSYDKLYTPIIDCVSMGDEQWLGIGDLHILSPALSELEFDWIPLVSNLSSDFPLDEKTGSTNEQLMLGSYVNYSLFSSKGIHMMNIKTDYEVLFKIITDPKSKSKKVCLTVSCADMCARSWSRLDHLNRFRYQNNLLEYRVCTANSLEVLISRQYRINELTLTGGKEPVELTEVMAAVSDIRSSKSQTEVESIVSGSSLNSSEQLPELAVSRQSTSRPNGSKIDLIEGVIFATSQEFMPILDEQTLIQRAEIISKYGLAMNSIILLDSRWETYVGSLKLNTVLFSDSELLFETLHSRGFKIVFAVEPYIDTSIGVGNLNDLYEAGRLYASNHWGNGHSKVITSLSDRTTQHTTKDTLIMRQSLFAFHNLTIDIESEEKWRPPYIFKCKESRDGYCAIIDLTKATNRAWMVKNIMQSSLLTKEADGIQIGGSHPDSYLWDNYYRVSLGELAKDLFYKEKVFIMPQWTGDLGYIQIAPRHCSWDGLRSTISSVLNLGLLGFPLIHSGSIWGDLVHQDQSKPVPIFKSFDRMNSIAFGDPNHSSDLCGEELLVRWLQVSMFFPILQFNNLAPLEHNLLKDALKDLTKIRKNYILPEIRRNLAYTPLANRNKSSSDSNHQPLIRAVWLKRKGMPPVAIAEQFMVGSDLMVAPILGEGIRQRDIYLPNGFWQDEIRQASVRGGGWLREYPVELNQVAWFTRADR